MYHQLRCPMRLWRRATFEGTVAAIDEVPIVDSRHREISLAHSFSPRLTYSTRADSVGLYTGSFADTSRFKKSVRATDRKGAARRFGPVQPVWRCVVAAHCDGRRQWTSF